MNNRIARRELLVRKTYRALPMLSTCKKLKKKSQRALENPQVATHRKVLSLNSSATLTFDQSPKRGKPALISRQLKQVNVATESHQIKFPLTPSVAIRLLQDYLSPFEIGEILSYKKIYYIGNTPNKIQGRSKAFNWGFDDAKGNYNIVVGDHIKYRYEVLNVIGKGSFGRVCKCIDHKTRDLVAVKVIKNKEKYHRQGMVEVKILAHLNTNDPEDEHHIVKMKAAFSFRNHLCIAFEILSLNLYELISYHQFQGMSVGLARHFSFQILDALRYVKSHEIVHCDLKPENILLSNHSSVKVIDFGSSCFQDEIIYTYIQSRFYRAPEILLGIKYTPAIDMWSFGCIVTELFTGHSLFSGENENEQMERMMELLGVPPLHVIMQSPRRHVFFDDMGNPKIVASKRVPASKTLSEVVVINDPNFIDFIRRVLEWDPAKRMTPEEALKHPWITDKSNNATRRRHLRSSSFLADI